MAAQGPDRRLPIDGTLNFRDVGGYPAGERTTRWGTLFRSDGLTFLTDRGREQFAGLGIRTVIDLRDEFERSAAPSRIDPASLNLVSIPLFQGSAASFIADDVSLIGLYREILTSGGAALAHAVRTIATADGPVLVHCTAGKDRTGIVIAMALLASGVERPAVVADYAATAGYLPAEILRPIIERLRREHDRELVNLAEVVASSPAPVLEQIVDELDARYGSPAGYLRAHGLTDGELRALRERILA